MFGHYVSSPVLLVGGQLREDKDRVRLQWCNQFWQNLEEGAGKRCSECVEVGGGEEKWRGRGGADFCIKMGNYESHFNISFIVKGKVTRQRL